MPVPTAFVPNGVGQQCQICGLTTDATPVYALPCSHGSAYNYPMHVSCVASTWGGQYTTAEQQGTTAAWVPCCPNGACSAALTADEFKDWERAAKGCLEHQMLTDVGGAGVVAVMDTPFAPYQEGEIEGVAPTDGAPGDTGQEGTGQNPGDDHGDPSEDHGPGGEHGGEGGGS